MPKKVTEKKTKKSPPKTSSRTPKEEKLFQNLQKTVEQCIAGKGFVPSTVSDFHQKLQIPAQHIAVFQEVLDAVVKKGGLEFSQGKYSAKKVHPGVISGVIRVHPRGFGFVQPDDPSLYDQDIFIPRHFTQNAVDGDKVEVVVDTLSFSEKGPEGKVVTILERGRTHMAGIVKSIYANGEIHAYVPLLGVSQDVVVESAEGKPLHVGDRIIMEVVDWGDKKNVTTARMSHYLGHISDAACDIPAAIEEYELRADFPTRVLEEAKDFGDKVSKKDLEGREDLRELECFTIDPDTAKDYDDALSLSKDKNGHYFLGVHIADVSHYVSKGTALDQEACRRGNSTYFPGFCLPMLPHELSSNLCSLREKVNRLTVSVHMHFDAEGTLLDYRLGRSVIKSKKRLTYNDAKQILDGKKKSSLAPTLDLMVELCLQLKKKRYERGSIEFAMPELVIQVNEVGVPMGTVTVHYDITHQLVEEFMLKANEVVASHLSNEGKILPFRIHEVPSSENMRDFALLAGAFGFQISENPTSNELQKLFDEALETSYGQYLATAYIRRMRLAIYSPENIGHYGLGLTHYCHFTSPIRRYIDLVIHRLIFGDSGDLTQISFIASQCSEQERLSAKAENSVILLKKLRLLDQVRKADPAKVYEVVITRVRNFGFFFEVLDFMLEGFLHVSEIGDDFYVFEEASLKLVGRRHGDTFCAGSRIQVSLTDIDFITMETKWASAEIVESNEQIKKKPSRKKERSSRAKDFLQKKPTFNKRKRK